MEVFYLHNLRLCSSGYRHHVPDRLVRWDRDQSIRSKTIQQPDPLCSVEISDSHNPDHIPLQILREIQSVLCRMDGSFRRDDLSG